MNNGSNNDSNSKQLVLIVDDMPDNIELASEILLDVGHETIIANNGRDAIDIARKEKPALILLDIAMPDMDGFETCTLLKQDEITKDIPVIFLSAINDSANIIRSFEIGAVDYIPKPFNTLELLSRVKTHLELTKNREELISMNNLLEDKVKRRTLELQKTNVELNRANNKLSQLDKTKTEFLTIISHELRTPLNGLLGYASLLEKTSVNTPDQKEFIDSINNIIKSLVKISEISLLFTELRAEGYQSNPKPYLLGELVNFVVEKSNIKNNPKHVLVQNHTLNKNVTLVTDELLFRSCLNIIIDNSLKYSPENGFVKVDVEECGDKIIIKVIDEGPGFSDKALNNVFELFETDTFESQYSGFGLGLATARLIMDSLNGIIEIVNNLDKGATVNLIFKSNATYYK